MASRKCRGTDKEAIEVHLDSVLESDSEESNASGDESDNSVYFSGTEDQCSDQNSGQSSESENDDQVAVPTKSTKRVMQKKHTNEWNWTKIENTKVIIPFSSYSGVSQELISKFESNSPSELSIFLEFMNPLFAIISRETNDYAKKQLNNPNRKKKKDDEKWVDTTEDEIKGYFALVILMSQVRKSRVQLYWSKNRCLETPIYSETMSRERLLLISRYLHFTDD
jgi:hypothetical protein